MPGHRMKDDPPAPAPTAARHSHDDDDDRRNPIRFLGSIVLGNLLGMSKVDLGESLCTDDSLAKNCPLYKGALSTATDSSGVSRTVFTGDPMQVVDCIMLKEAQQAGICKKDK